MFMTDWPGIAWNQSQEMSKNIWSLAIRYFKLYLHFWVCSDQQGMLRNQIQKCESNKT